MSSRSHPLTTPALFVAAACCCLGTSKAFVLTNNRIANINNSNNWKKADSSYQAPLAGIGFAPGHMLSHSSSSSRRFAADNLVRLPRVPSAMDHVESSRSSSCLLRLQDVFEELTEAVKCGEVATKGRREGEEDLSWIKDRVLGMAQTAPAAATPGDGGGAAAAAPAVPEYEWYLPELIAAAGGSGESLAMPETSATGRPDDGSDQYSFTVILERGVMHQASRDPSHLQGRSEAADRSRDTSSPSTNSTTNTSTRSRSTRSGCSADSCSASYSSLDSGDKTSEEERCCSIPGRKMGKNGVVVSACCTYT